MNVNRTPNDIINVFNFDSLRCHGGYLLVLLSFWDGVKLLTMVLDGLRPWVGMTGRDSAVMWTVKEIRITASGKLLLTFFVYILLVFFWTLNLNCGIKLSVFYRLL